MGKVENNSNDDSAELFFDKHLELDDKCRRIFVVLIECKKLRLGKLLSALKKLGVKISKPTLLAHLDHLIQERLIERKEEGFQNVSYGVTEKVKSAFNVSEEDVKEMFEVFENDEKIPKHLKSLKITAKEFYASLSEEEIDRVSNIDLVNILRLNLIELKTFIDYDLKLDKFESDKNFWNFIGNPIYRMSEKSAVEKCRDNEMYKKKFFEKN